MSIREDLYSALSQRNNENVQFQVDRVEDQHVLRAADINELEERSVNTEPKTIEEFYELFQKVLTVAEQEFKVNYDLSVTEAYPPEEAELPCITCHLLSREPFSGGGQARAAELKPRYIREEIDPEFPDNFIQIFSHRFENTIEMTIWARTNKVANELAEFVEKVFFTYLWVFRWGGFSQPPVYLGRKSDDVEKVRNNLIHKRSLRFFIITSRITKRRVASLKRILVEIGIIKPSE